MLSATFCTRWSNRHLKGISLLRTGCERRWSEWTIVFSLKDVPDMYLFLLFPIYSLICDVHVWISRTTYIHLLKQLYYSIYYVINPLSRRFPCSSFFNIFELNRDHLLSCPQSQKVLLLFGELRALRSPGALLRVLPGSRVGCESVKTVLSSNFTELHQALLKLQSETPSKVCGGVSKPSNGNEWSKYLCIIHI